MNGIPDIEQQLIAVERKCNELEIQNDTLELGIQDLLQQCNVTEEQLSSYVSSPHYFSASNWKSLQEEKSKLENKLNQELASIVDPRKTKKSRQEILVPPHWLFVR